MIQLGGKAARLAGAIGLLILLIACQSSAPPTVLTASPPVTQQAPTELAPTSAPTATMEVAWDIASPNGVPNGACAGQGGLSLAYVKDQNLWWWELGVEPRALTSSNDVMDVVISPDGCAIAFVRSAYDAALLTQELWIIQSDGSDERLLVGQDFLGQFAPSEFDSTILRNIVWRPGQEVLAFNTHRYIEPWTVPNDDLHQVDLASGNISTLLSAGNGGDFYFSPTGDQIALTLPTSVNLLDSEGADLTRDLITFPAARTYSEYSYYPSVDWSADGDSFLVAIPPEDQYADLGPGILPKTDLWQVGSDQSVLRLGPIETMTSFGGEYFSPDQSYLAYLRPTIDLYSDEWELVVASPHGDHDFFVREGRRINFGDWSPDSNHFAFWYETENRTVEIHVCAVASWMCEVIGLPGLEDNPRVGIVWSTPDYILVELFGQYPARDAIFVVSPSGEFSLIDQHNPLSLISDVAP